MTLGTFVAVPAMAPRLRVNAREGVLELKTAASFQDFGLGEPCERSHDLERTAQGGVNGGLDEAEEVTTAVCERVALQRPERKAVNIVQRAPDARLCQ